jgi:hypothetical protein
MAQLNITKHDWLQNGLNIVLALTMMTLSALL